MNIIISLSHAIIGALELSMPDQSTESHTNLEIMAQHIGTERGEAVMALMLHFNFPRQPLLMTRTLVVSVSAIIYFNEGNLPSH